MTRKPNDAAPEDRTRDHEDESVGSSIFLRGLSLGALIGAAIAGSAIWERRRERRAAATSRPATTEIDPPA